VKKYSVIGSGEYVQKNTDIAPIAPAADAAVLTSRQSQWVQVSADKNANKTTLMIRGS